MVCVDGVDIADVFIVVAFFCVIVGVVVIVNVAVVGVVVIGDGIVGGTCVCDMIGIVAGVGGVVFGVLLGLLWYWC